MFKKIKSFSKFTTLTKLEIKKKCYLDHQLNYFGFRQSIA